MAKKEKVSVKEAVKPIIVYQRLELHRIGNWNFRQLSWPEVPGKEEGKTFLDFSPQTVSANKEKLQQLLEDAVQAGKNGIVLECWQTLPLQLQMAAMAAKAGLILSLKDRDGKPIYVD